MSDLQELLVRGAGDAPVRLSIDDVRQRVHRRRRTRRSVTAVVGLLLVGGTITLVATRDEDPSRLEASNGLEREVVGRWAAAAYSAVVVDAGGVYLQIDPDGEFQGSDGCNPFDGRWTVEEARLVVSDLSVGTRRCWTGDPGLLDVLRSSPTIGTFDSSPGSLRLDGRDQWIAFSRLKVDEEGRTETHISVPLASGGMIEATFVTPARVPVGGQQELARWGVSTTGKARIPVWMNHAIAGLPETCDVHPWERWEEIEPQVIAGVPPDATRSNVDSTWDGKPLVSSRRDLPTGCEGSYDLVMIVMAEGGYALGHTPITIG